MNLRRLVKLAARAFYDDLTSKGDNQPKTGRSDNRGIAVVVLDALTRFEFSSCSLRALEVYTFLKTCLCCVTLLKVEDMVLNLVC